MSINPSSLESRIANRESTLHVVRIIVGLLLIATAGLKHFAGNDSSLPRIGWMANPDLRSFIAAGELLLGLWLLSGFAKPLSWLMSLIVFASFAIVSGSLGIRGVADCGCFGTIKASPWVAFGIDVVVLLGLLFARPSRSSWAEPSLKAEAVHLLIWSAGTAAILLTVGSVGSYAYGSLPSFLAKLRGQSLACQRLLDFGEAGHGERLEKKAAVTNLTSEPIRLIGGTSDCSCISTVSLPITIEPRSSVEIPVILKVPGTSAGTFTRTAELWTDSEQMKFIRIILTCSIVSPSP